MTILFLAFTRFPGNILDSCNILTQILDSFAPQKRLFPLGKQPFLWHPNHPVVSNAILFTSYIPSFSIAANVSSKISINFPTSALVMIKGGANTSVS